MGGGNKKWIEDVGHVPEARNVPAQPGHYPVGHGSQMPGQMTKNHHLKTLIQAQGQGLGGFKSCEVPACRSGAARAGNSCEAPRGNPCAAGIRTRRARGSGERGLCKNTKELEVAVMLALGTVTCQHRWGWGRRHLTGS